MKTEEAKVKDKVKAYLRSVGAYYFMPVQTGYGAPSLDILGCYRGKFFAVETKAPGKEPTPRQYAIIGELYRAGAFTVWGSDAQEIIRQLGDCFAQQK